MAPSALMDEEPVTCLGTGMLHGPGIMLVTASSALDATPHDGEPRFNQKPFDVTLAAKCAAESTVKTEKSAGKEGARLYGHIRPKV